MATAPVEAAAGPEVRRHVVVDPTSSPVEVVPAKGVATAPAPVVGVAPAEAAARNPMHRVAEAIAEAEETQRGRHRLRPPAHVKPATTPWARAAGYA